MLTRVSVIGLGAMGLPMATRLAQRFSVTGFDPLDTRREMAESAGVATASSPDAATRNSELALVAVRDRVQTEIALFGPHGAAASMEPGSLVVLTSTIGPEAAIAIAEELVQGQLRVIDAPVSGGPARAGTGELLMVVGADSESMAMAAPVLEHLASTLTVVGPHIGDGQMLKVINQLLAGVHIAAAGEAIALARAVGLDPTAVIAALSEGAGSSFMLKDRGPRMVESLHGDAEVRSRIDIFVKDMGIVTDVAKRSHVPTPLASAAEQLYLLAERAGLGASDDSSIVTVLSPREPNS